MFRGNSTYSGALKNINSLPQQSKNFYVVSSEGFNQSLNDFLNVHFTTQEYRDFGARYAEKMIEVLGDKINPVETETPVSSSSVPESSSDITPVSSADVSPTSSFDQTGIVALSAHETFAVGNVYNDGKNLFVPVNLSRAGAVSVTIYSSLGKVVSNFSGRYEVGENLISLNKGCLPAGVYMLSVQVNGSRAVKRFLVNQ